MENELELSRRKRIDGDLYMAVARVQETAESANYIPHEWADVDIEVARETFEGVKQMLADLEEAMWELEDAILEYDCLDNE